VTEVDPAQLSAVPDKVRKVSDGARCRRPPRSSRCTCTANWPRWTGWPAPAYRWSRTPGPAGGGRHRRGGALPGAGPPVAGVRAPRVPPRARCRTRRRRQRGPARGGAGRVL